ncbi:MAG: ribosomal protein S18-alanine N-acetyltransferase [Candidatus Longimicrobiales bacterium M2_2A_002]
MSTTRREAGGRPGAGWTDIVIRPMEPGDLDAVLAIERTSFAVPWTPSTFRSLLKRHGSGLWVAVAGGRVAGYAVVWAVLDQAELGNVAVAAGHRRQGIASRLVDTVVEWLRERGVRELFLEVRESNEAAQRLYAAHGFERVGRRKGYYTRPREDALVLRRAVGGLTD